MPKELIKVLLVEDNPADVLLLQEALAGDLFATFQITNVERLSLGLKRLQEQHFDAILLDIGLPDSQGLTTFEQVHRQALDIPVVVMSGLVDEQIAFQAVQAGAQDYLVKGSSGRDSVARTIRYAIERQQARAALRASEQRFRALIEHSVDAVAMVGADGNYLYESPAAVRILGYTPEELAGRDVFTIVHPDDRAAAAELFGQVIKQPHTPITGQLRYRHKDGSWLWVEGTATNLLDDPSVEAIVVIYRDITERKQVEQALRESEEIFRTLYENSTIGLYRTTPDGSILLANPTLVELLGYSTFDELSSRNLAKDGFEPSYDRTQFLEIIEREGEIKGLESSWTRRDGTAIFIRESARATRNPQGKILYYDGIVEDFTERKRAEEQLKIVLARLQRLVDANVVGIVVGDNEGRIFEANDYYLDLLGYTRAELEAGQVNWKKMTPPEHLPVDYRAIAELEQRGVSTPYEKEYFRKDGTRVWVLIGDAMLHEEGGKIIAFILNISERKLAEEARKESEERYRSLFENMLEGYAYCRMFYEHGEPQDFVYIDVNEVFEGLTGLKNVVGKNVSEVIPGIRQTNPELFEIYSRVALTGQPESFETYIETLGIWFSISVYSPEKEYFIAIFNNITERKQAEQTLLESERQMRALVTSLDDIVFEFDEDGTYLNIWAANEGLLARPRSALIGRRIAEILGEEAARMFVEPFKRVLASGQAENLEYPLEVGDGQRWFLARISPIRSADGSYRTVSMLIRDTTERKQAEQALRESEERYRSLVEVSPDAIFVNREEQIVFINQRGLELLGASTPEQILGMSPFEVFHPAYHAIIRERIQRMLELWEVAPLIEEKIVRLDGSTVPVEVIAAPLMDQGVPAIQVVIRDITDRKQAEEALVHLSRRMELILNSAGEGIYGADTAGNAILMNPALAQMVGRESTELLGQPTHELFHHTRPDGRPYPREECPISHSIRDGIPHHAENEVFWRKDGTSFPVEYTSTPIWEGDRVAGAVVVVKDITERKRTEEETLRRAAELEQRVVERTADLSRANAELAQAARAKDEFLASMSHELRTPLNAILTLAESLEEGTYGQLNDRQLKPLRTVAESGHHLLNLINDILDLSKIEAGRLELQIEPLEVESLCQASLRLIKQQAQKKRLQVSLTVDEAVKSLRADGRYLKQMLVNLLSNAVKFTPEGGQIGIEVQGDAKQGVAHFTVWDTGIGIAPEHAQLLFKPFVQVDSGLTRQYGGTGLGLSLVYRMAELHGGSVSLLSAPGQGSRFTISLKWAGPGEPRGTGPLAPTRVPNVRQAFVIEDSPTAADQLARYMGELGASVTVYPAGESALLKAIEVQPDVILLDIQLPGLSGWEVLAQLKDDERTRSIPVIVISVVDEPARGLALGAADYVVKPLTRSRLHEALWKALIPVLDPGTPQSASARLPVLLIAEDNPANQATYSDYLSTKGYQIVLAANGAEAIERAREARPDLILMDVQMPGMDGLAATRRLRADPDLGTIPIIALTALVMPGDRERCLAAGMNVYLTKPVSLNQLAQTVEVYLHRRR